MSLKRKIFEMFPRSIQAPLERWYYARQVRRFREDQWPPANALKSLLHPGDGVIDIGANIGYVTMLLTRMTAPGGKALSVEPVPATFNFLSHNCASLGLNAIPVHAAVSDKPGLGYMEMGQYPDGSENPYEAHLVQVSEEPFAAPVDIVTLDMLAEDYAFAPRFIKIDVEGHEYHVLKGGEKTLRRYYPHLLIEMNDDMQDRKTESGKAFEFLAAMGYEARSVRDGKIEPLGDGVQDTDILFMKSPNLI